MKREEHKIELKNRVLNAATKLFMSQGYSKTTIQQITGEAQLTTGSLYHFFSNKEDILLHMTRDMFAASAETSDRMLNDKDDPCLRFSLEIALQCQLIMKYERIAEIYLAAYSSSEISRHIVQMGAKRNSELFMQYNPDYTADDYFARTLAVKGILHSFVDELVNFKRIPETMRIESILEMVLLIFNVPAQQIKKTIKRTRTIIKDNPNQIRKGMVL